MTSNPLTVLVDMDGILADAMGKYLARYNEERCLRNNPATVADITTWDISKALPGATEECFSERGFFSDLEPIVGSLEAMREIHGMGHEVIICSSPGGPSSAMEKLEWLAKHLPWLDRRAAILCHRKHLIAGDVLIDDKPDHLERWSLEANPLGSGRI